MNTQVTENEVALAERYAAALQTIDEAAAFVESSVELAERYATALQTIDEAAAITDAELERAERYAAALKRIEDADDAGDPTLVIIHLDDAGRVAEVESNRDYVHVLINPVGSDLVHTPEGDVGAAPVGAIFQAACKDDTGRTVWNDAPASGRQVIPAVEYDRELKEAVDRTHSPSAIWPARRVAKKKN